MTKPARAHWHVKYDDDASRVEIAPGLTVPPAFCYSVSPPAVPLTVSVHICIRDGVAVCDRVEVARHDGRSVTAQDVRGVTFGELIASAPLMAASATHSGPIRVGDPARAGEDELVRVRRAMAANASIPVDLSELATVYRDAMRDGQPPIPAVASVFGLSYRTAQRRVNAAREAGHLGEAIRRRAGEAKARGGLGC